EGRPQPPPEEYYELPFDNVTRGYFQTMRIALVRGRTFTEYDQPGAPRAAVINETMVRRFFPNEDPLGKRFTFGDGGPNSNWYTIVGVIRDVRRGNLRRPIRAEAYFSAEQIRPRTMMLVVRTQQDPVQLTTAVRRQVRELDPEQPVFAVATLDQQVAEMIAQPRFSMILLGSFAGLAMLLAAVGIYGVMAYAVANRTHEIGIRMALGASPGAVLRLVLQQGLLLALAGVALGTAGALALTRLMSSLLFEVRATDPWTYAGVAVLLVGVALLACYIPARRAMRVDPIQALRYE
ncbi:MAG TPA: FtsX-like permease family protein, partial [Candidatus Acidoferrales bacterium]